MTAGLTRAPGPRPAASAAALVLERLVRLYQLTFAALFAGQCRFEPSCSAYARDALRGHGAIRGSWLTLARIARCQPWCKGGYDPVPGACSHRAD